MIQRRHDEESGFFMVMFALVLVVLMLSIGFVLEFGALRAGRQENKSAADFAVAAGLRSLEGTPGTPTPWLGICGAVSYLEANNDKFEGMTATFETGAGGVVAFDPCDPTDPGYNPVVVNAPCDPSSTATWGVWRGTSSDGNTIVTVRSGYTLPDPDFSEEDVSQLGGSDTGNNPCEQLAVVVRDTVERGFSSVIGGDDLTASIRSVGRVEIGLDKSAVAALLMLERNGCNVFQASGQGKVVVQAPSATNPGITHADSAGAETGSSACADDASGVPQTNSNGYVIYATALPPASGGGPSLVNEPAGALPGILSMYAEAIASDHTAYQLGTGITPNTVTVGAIASRSHVDDKYNPATAPAISNLHSAARTLTTAASVPAGYTEITGASCAEPGTITGTHLWINCPVFSAGAATILQNATDIVFTGKVEVKNNKALWMPAAERLYVRGCTTGCSGNGYYSMSVAGSGQIRVNASNTATPTTLESCASRSGPGAGGTHTQTTQIATLSGPVNISGQISMCQSTLYVGADHPAYQRRSDTSGGPNCSTTLPCPYGTNSGQTVPDTYIEISGGNANADWSAPNQYGANPDLGLSPTEDLALWTEGTDGSTVKGTGTSRTEGVFFAPNATVTFNGQASQAQPLNAQFISRRLTMSGQGDLNIKPSPDDSISTPFFANFELVR